MKLNSNYRLRHIAGENIIIAAGGTETDLTRVVTLNETAAWLWDELQACDFTAEDVAQRLTARYEVTPAEATADAAAWLEVLRTNGLLA